MIRVILKITSVIFFAFTLISGFIFINRMRLPYNSEGNFFDQQAVIVYHEQAVVAYGLLTIAFMVAAIVIFLLAKIKPMPPAIKVSDASQ